jgi:MOSC domain-containing protein YiiM
VPVDPESPLGRLMAGPLRPGRVVWIGLRSERKAPPHVVAAATLVAGRGVAGDHYDSRRNGPRQVTLIAEEDIAAIASFVGRRVEPVELRRNIVVGGVNLNALKDRRFRVGGALLEYSGPCEPCGRIEANLGPGGFNAARGRGGITARILEGGEVRVGDPVTRVD